MAGLITIKQLEARVSPRALRDAYDDDDDGKLNVGSVNELIEDASAMVRSYLGPIYDLTQISSPAVQREVVRLTLDVAQAEMAYRFPEAVRVDGEKNMKKAVAGLERLRKADVNLGVTTAPEPAANTGGDVEALDEDNPDLLDPMFAGQRGVSGFNQSG